MTYKVAYCAGHGYNTPGKRTPDDEREWTFNDKVARAFHSELLKYENVQLKRMDDASGKTDVSLGSRTSGANSWGADLYLSFHHNANTGKWGNWTGIETYPGSSSTSQAIGKLIHDAMVNAYGLRDRGIKSKNLHITRETKMPSVLIEGCYMDSTIDIKVLRDDKVLENAGRLVAHAVAKHAKLKLKEGKVVKTESQVVQPKSEPISSPADLPEVTSFSKYPRWIEITQDTGKYKYANLSHNQGVIAKGTQLKVYGGTHASWKAGEGIFIQKKDCKEIPQTVITGGLNSSYVNKIEQYFREKGLEASLQFVDEGNPYAKATLVGQELYEFQLWLEEQNWYFKTEK